MERLTFEAHDRGIFVKESDVKTFDVEDENMHTGNAIRKLAEYEDLEEQGLLLKLPCKVGTKVYMLREDIEKIIDGEVTSFRIGEFVSTAKVFITDDIRYTEITFDNFGKKVFLTQAKAEESLKGMDGEEIVAGIKKELKEGVKECDENETD